MLEKNKNKGTLQEFKNPGEFSKRNTVLLIIE
jgi:hypothetical protein